MPLPLRRLAQTTLATCAMIFIPVMAQAAMPNRFIMALDNSFSISFTHSHVAYGERANGSNSAYLDTDSGFAEGARVALSGMRYDDIGDLYARVSYGQTNGTLNYVGALQNGTPYDGTQNSKITDVGLRFGQAFVTSENTLLIPYLAYGNHHWGRGALPSISDPYDTYESYRNQYLGLGLMWQAALWNRLVATINLVYARTIHPTISSPALNFAEGLGTGPWERAGLSLDYRIARHETVFASAAYTTFQYGSGPVVPTTTPGIGISEPYSKTEIMNYNFGIRFLY